jgi:hypothetical protein
MEMKVGKPDESIWDAIKLADVQAYAPTVRAGYLISDAKWNDGAEGSSLFVRLPTRTKSCRELIAESPAAWAGTMVGGNGIRPRTSVGAVELTWVWQAALARHPGRRLIAVRVRPDSAACRETYDAEGFPVGYEPTAGLRAKVRRADEHLAHAATGTPEPGTSTDPCHGYPWYERWTQQRIVAVVRVIADDHAARACLRRRLAVERGWNEHELRARFDPD